MAKSLFAVLFFVLIIFSSCNVENPKTEDDLEELSLSPISKFLKLDGIDDFGQIAFHSSMFIDIEITIEALIYLNELPNESNLPIISQSHGGSQAGNYLIYISKDGLSFIYQPISYTDNYYQPSCLIEPNRWYHIAVVFDYNDHENTHLYLNGEEITTVWNYAENTPINELPNPNSNGDYFVGFYDIYNPQYFNGNLDELRIWETLRSKEDIVSKMQTELVGNESGLVGYWTFNENSENTVDDKCSGNDLVLRNGAKISD